MARQIDAVLRIYDMAELPCVRSCVFSLLGQMQPAVPLAAALSRSLRIHLMTQRFTSDEAQELRGSLADLLRLDDRVGLILHNWDYRDPFDLRVPLLNLALDVTHGRYLTCLDSTDLLRPGALAALLRQLEVTGAAAALGGMNDQRVRWWGNAFVPLEPPSRPPPGREANFVFLLDRTRLDTTLRFQVSPPGAETADFIRRLRKHHAVDEEHVTDPLCVRQIFQS